MQTCAGPHGAACSAPAPGVRCHSPGSKKVKGKCAQDISQTCLPCSSNCTVLLSNVLLPNNLTAPMITPFGTPCTAIAPAWILHSRHQERPRRPWGIWLLDISKQGFSSGKCVHQVLLHQPSLLPVQCSRSLAWYNDKPLQMHSAILGLYQ